jgi:hypothetical protein
MEMTPHNAHARSSLTALLIPPNNFETPEKKQGQRGSY